MDPLHVKKVCYSTIYNIHAGDFHRSIGFLDNEQKQQFDITSTHDSTWNFRKRQAIEIPNMESLYFFEYLQQI